MKLVEALHTMAVPEAIRDRLFWTTSDGAEGDVWYRAWKSLLRPLELAAEPAAEDALDELFEETRWSISQTCCVLGSILRRTPKLLTSDVVFGARPRRWWTTQ